MTKYTSDLESLKSHPLPAWFDNAKFGIFVHWYPSTIPSYAPITDDPFALQREQGERTAFLESPYAEWYWNSLQFPESSVAKYHTEKYGERPYEEFIPEFFEATLGWQPQRWAELFSASGAMYCVMGTKHHDGALLWPSETPNPVHGEEWSSRRDLVGECADAVRSEGMRFGVYYSGGLDWTFAGPGIDSIVSLFEHIPQTDEYHAYADTHYRELIRRYKPDILWNDIGYPRFGEGAADLFADFYNQNLQGVINNRFDFIGVMKGTAHADFLTPEYSSGMGDGSKKFEVCRGIGSSFGYNEQEDETTYLSATALIRLLINVVADGGNLLLNVGPLATGEIPWSQQERLLAIGQWLSLNGEAIYSSSRHELPSLTTSEELAVRLTRGTDGCTFAMVMGRPDSREIVISGLPEGTVSLLGYDGTLQRDGDRITLPYRPDATPAFTLRIRET